MRKFYSVIVITVFVVFNLISCYNDIDIFNLSDEVKLDQAAVIPIGGTNATTLEILTRLRNTQDWIVDSTNNEIYFEKLDTITYKYKNIDLSKKIYPSSVEYQLNTDLIPKIASPNTSGVVINNTLFTTGINNNLTDERFDSIRISSMTLTCNVGFQDIGIPASKLKIKIIIPNTYLKFPNTHNDTITFTPSAYYVDNDVVLNNVKLSFPNGANSIPIKSELYYNTGGNSYVLNTDSKISATFSIKNINYTVAYGYFKPKKYSNPTEKSTLDYFSNLPGGYLKFSNPQIFIRANTNIGTYLLFRFDYVRAYLSNDPTYQPIYASFDGNRSFTQGLEKPQKPAEFKETTMRTFDKDFGHTYLLFDSLRRPNVFEYQFTSMLDSDRIKTDPAPNFLVPNSKIDLYIRSKMMLYFNEGSFYEANDTSAVSEQIDATLNSSLQIDTCFIVLSVKNGFPCQAIAKVKMLDAYGQQVLTDLQSEYTILSAPVDANGNVVKINKQIIKIPINEHYLEELKKVKSFITSVLITGENGTQGKKKIHLTQDNYIDARVGLYVKFNSVVKLKQ